MIKANRGKGKAIFLYSTLTFLSLILAIALPVLLNPSGTSSTSLSHNDFELWPYTLTGEVVCLPQSRETQHLVLRASDGQLYAINGLARSSGQYQDINDFWKDDPTQPGLKINVDQVISRGLALCR